MKNKLGNRFEGKYIGLLLFIGYPGCHKIIIIIIIIIIIMCYYQVAAENATVAVIEYHWN